VIAVRVRFPKLSSLTLSGRHVVCGMLGIGGACTGEGAPDAKCEAKSQGESASASSTSSGPASFGASSREPTPLFPCLELLRLCYLEGERDIDDRALAAFRAMHPRARVQHVISDGVSSTLM
jgi:hypothetical protein